MLTCLLTPVGPLPPCHLLGAIQVPQRPRQKEEGLGLSFYSGELRPPEVGRLAQAPCRVRVRLRSRREAMIEALGPKATHSLSFLRLQLSSQPFPSPGHPPPGALTAPGPEDAVGNLLPTTICVSEGLSWCPPTPPRLLLIPGPVSLQMSSWGLSLCDSRYLFLSLPETSPFFTGALSSLHLQVHFSVSLSLCVRSPLSCRFPSTKPGPVPSISHILSH